MSCANLQVVLFTIIIRAPKYYAVCKLGSTTDGAATGGGAVLFLKVTLYSILKRVM